MHSDTAKAILSNPDMLETYVGPVVEPEPWTQYGLFTGDTVDVRTLANSYDVYMDKAEADAFYEGELDAFREAILAATTPVELLHIYSIANLFDHEMADYVPQWMEEPTAKRLMHCRDVRVHTHAVWRTSKAVLVHVGNAPRGGAYAPNNKVYTQGRKEMVGQP